MSFLNYVKTESYVSLVDVICKSDEHKSQTMAPSFMFGVDKEGSELQEGSLKIFCRASYKGGGQVKESFADWSLHSCQNRPFSYWSVIFSIPVLQLIVLETGNVLMGHPN